MSGEANQVKWRGVQPVSGIRGIWPAIDSDRINKAGYRTTAGTTIIYTVPAGKRLFVPNVTMTTRHTAAGTAYPNVIVRNVADVTEIEVIHHYYTVAGQDTTTQSFQPALEAEAGWDVCLRIHTANTVARAYFFGWLEDA